MEPLDPWEVVTSGKRKTKPPQPPAEGWTESQHYAFMCGFRMKMDPDNPNTKRANQVASEILWKYVCTHTVAECEEMIRRAAETREIRRRLFGRPRPIIEWERQRQWIAEFGLSPVLGCELDDPC